MGFPAASVAVPALEAGQFNFGGVTFGGVVAGTPYQLVQAQGHFPVTTVTGIIEAAAT